LSHVEKNRSFWEGESDEYQARHGEQLSSNYGWGTWQLPEEELGVLGEVEGLDVLELGCGAAQWSINLARRGARPTGLDLSPRQLAHARGLMEEEGVDFPLIEANAEQTPLPDGSFDIVFCDHGAFNFADPRLLVPEAARLLRPRGLLAFCMPTPLLDLVYDVKNDTVGEALFNDYFDLHGSEDAESVDFQLPYGEWIRLFRANDLVVEDLIEIQAPEAGETSYHDFAPHEWSRRWPAEHIWKARRA
jgi:SAM-dependent methyltransferase